MNIKTEKMSEQAKEIVDNRDFENMVSTTKHPEPGEYVITGIQAGNLHGECGWQYYIGYVVQVRKKVGAFGTDIVLLRHPDGTLWNHQNQSFFRMNDFWIKKAKALFPDGMTPEEYEDYSKPYTLAGETYPETGKIIYYTKNMPPCYDSPMVQITVNHDNDSKTIIAV